MSIGMAAVFWEVPIELALCDWLQEPILTFLIQDLR